MRIYPILILTIVVLISFLACKDNEISDAKMEVLARMQCRAIQFKDERFRLAGVFMKMEMDTSIIGKIKMDSLKNEIQKVQATSGQLSDSIKTEIEDIFMNQLKKDADRRKFNEALMAKVKSLNCENNTIPSTE